MQKKYFPLFKLEDTKGDQRSFEDIYGEGFDTPEEADRYGAQIHLHYVSQSLTDSLFATYTGHVVERWVNESF